MRGSFIGFATDSYTEDVKTVLRSYKELGESALATDLAAMMLPLFQGFDSVPPLLIPIPSNQSSLRERGYNPAELLCRELARFVPGVTWRNHLVRTRTTNDQSKLLPGERALNQAGSMVARVSNQRVLLIDDIVTTGATLLEAKRALENSGNLVTGFIAFAETETKKV